MAFILAMVAWISDNLDGFMARRIPNRQPSWLGRHEFAVDVVFTWATLAFILLAGFLPWWRGGPGTAQAHHHHFPAHH